MKTAGLLTLPLFILLIAVFILLNIKTDFEPPLVLPVMNTLFLGIIPVFIASVAYRTYRINGSASVLLLGSGMLVFGLGSIAAGWLIGFPDGSNIAITIYNTSAFIGSAFSLAAVLLVLTGAIPATRKTEPSVPFLAYGGAIAFIALFSYAAVEGVIPPFFIPVSGPTVLRQVVLSYAGVMYTLTSVLFFVLYQRKRDDFFFWFSLALGLIATGLFAVLFLSAMGSLTVWTGRIAEYVGACFALVAILAARETATRSGISLPAQFGTFFGREAATNAILAAAQESIWLFGTDDTIRMANPTALERLGGRSAGEVIGHRYQEFMSKELAQSRRARLEEVMRKKEPVRFEDERNGILFDHSFYPVFDDDGTVTGIAAFSRDITAVRNAEDALFGINEELTATNEELTAMQEDLQQNLDQLRRSEQKLRESEERYRTVADFAMDWEFWFGPDGKFIYLSPSTERILGRPVSHYTDVEPFLREVVHPDDLPQRLDHFRDEIAGRGPSELEFRIVRPDGEVRWIHHVCRPILDPSGRFLGTRGSNRDITERRLAEKAIRESEEKYRNLFTQMSEGFALHEIVCNDSGEPNDYRFLEINPAFEELTGLKRADVVGKLVSEVFPGTEAVWIRRYGAVALTGKSDKFENYSGVLERYYSVVAFSPAPRQFAVLFADVTERRQAGEALRKAHDELEIRVKDRTAELNRASAYNRSLIEASLDPLVTINPEGKISDVNSATVRATGYLRNELIGTDFSAYFTEPDRAKAGYEAVFRDGFVKDYGLGIRHRDGRVTPVLYNASVFRNEAGDVTGVFAAARDVSALKKAEETIHRAHEETKVERQRLYDVLEKLPVYVCLLDKDYRMPFANRYFKETFGYSQEKCCYEFLFNRTEPCENCETYVVMKTRALNHWFWTGPNGRDYDIYDYPFIDTNGSFMILEMGIDITERKKAEEALRRSYDLLEKRVMDRTAELAEVNTQLWTEIEERKRAEDALRETSEYLEKLITHANAPIIVWDRDFRITRFNHAAEILTGKKAEDMIGERIEVIFPEKYVHEVMDLIRQTMTGEQLHVVELPVLHRSGSVRVVLWNSASLYGPDGKTIESTIAQGQDITVRKRAEAELQRKNKELQILNEEITATQEELQQNVDELYRSEEALRRNEADLREALSEKEVLLAEIHHRVKNNLTAFISLLSLEGSYEESPAGLALKKDLQNRARSMALIHETLYRTGKYSSVEMGMYLSTLVGQIASSFDPEQAVRIVVSCDGVSIDLARATPCGLIVNELVTNSFKYAFPASFDCPKFRGEPCTITISIAEEGDAYVMTVRDNGIGLPAGFDARQARSLGLKLVNFLARHQLRANIDILSGDGTAFEFRFPVNQQHRKGS